MGSQFSSGPFCREVDPLVNLRVTSIRAKLYHLNRSIEIPYEEPAFVTKKQLQLVLKLSDRKIFDIFNIFDRRRTGKISRQEFFGALALASCDIPSDKVGLGFYIADENKDNFLSAIEVETLITCATRGLSAMKNIEFPTDKTIRKIVASMFGSHAVTLNEKGCINAADMKAFCQVNDLCRTYLADLGTQVEMLDSGKLVAQRKNLQMELLRIQSKLSVLKSTTGYKEEDEKAYSLERGGDYLLLKFDPEDAKDDVVPLDTAADDIYARARRKALNTGDGEDGISEAQRLRRLRRKNADKRSSSSNLLNDAVVFARGCKPTDSAGGFSTMQRVIEQSIIYRWATLEPQASDRLFKLDIDTVEDLFEAAGISMSDADAQQCLDAIPVNCLGRSSCSDVIAWYRDFMMKTSNGPALQWRQLARRIGYWWNETKTMTKKYQQLLWKQLEVISELDKSSKLIEAYAAKEQNINNQRQKNYNLSQISKKNHYQHSSSPPSAIQTSSFSLDEKEPFRFSTEINAAGVYEKPQEAGFSKIQAWHRNQLLKPPASVSANFKFGVIEEFVFPGDKKNKDKSKSSSAVDSLPLPPKRAQAKTKGAGLKTGMRSGLKLQIIVNPVELGSPFPPLRDPTDITDNTLSKFPVDLIPIDFLDVYKDIPAESVIWLCFDVVENINHINSQLLVNSAKNFFSGIPVDYRNDFYTHVDAFIIQLPKGDDSESAPREDTSESAGRRGGGRDVRKKSVQQAATATVVKRALFVALYNENNYLKDFEDKMPAGVYISRVIRKLDVSLESDKSFDELYEESLKFLGFDKRLFGPQEDEIGEECMNPLKFAKVNKKRREACEDVLKHINAIATEELQKQLQAHGLSDSGSRAELIDKVTVLFKRQIDIIGFGELSKFGDNMVREIFSAFDLDKDGALSFWELNSWLFYSGARTISNTKDYKSLVKSLGLQLDKNEHITLDGIIAYYEQYGRLERDIRALGIGSLNSLLKGELNVIFNFDKDALMSIEQLFEKHTLFFPQLKNIFNILTSLHNFRVDGDYRFFGDIPVIRDNEDICEILRTPGWLAESVNAFTTFLADGEDGLIRSIRSGALETFGKFSIFDTVIQSFTVLRDADDEATLSTEMKEEDNEKVADALPKVIDSANISSRLVELYSLNEELLENITNQSSMLSRNEREKLKVKLSEVDTEIRTLKARLESTMSYVVAHSAAFYDSIRMLTSGPVSIGLGTREFCVKLSIDGLNWTHLLPKAKGEPCAAKKREIDKIERASKRKKAAIAAIRRERARRNMTDEDKERIRLEKIEKARMQLEKQWQTLFNEAYGLLCDLREERSNHSLKDRMMHKWEYFCEFTEAKYTNTLKHAAVFSNFSAIIAEFFKRNTSKLQTISNNLQVGAEIIEKMMNPFIVTTTVELIDGSTETTTSLSLEAGKDESQSAAYTVLLQNYISNLRLANDISALKKSRDKIIQIALLSDSISEKDMKKISIERSLAGVHIIPFDANTFQLNLEKSIEEGRKLLVTRSAPPKKDVSEEMSLMSGDATDYGDDSDYLTNAGSKSGSLSPGISVALSKEDKRRLKKEKAEKREADVAQRNAAKSKAIEDRLKYYAMIQNDGITKLFNTIASNPEMASKFSGVHGDNSEIVDRTERQNTLGQDEAPTTGVKYDLVIDIGGIDSLTPRHAKDFAVNPLPVSKSELEVQRKRELEEEDARAAALRAERSEAEGDVEGLHGDIPEGCGVAIAVRKDGATVREGLDIDHSEIVYKVRQSKKVFFDERKVFWSTDRRCLPVERLHVYVTTPKEGLKVGWVSLTGRTPGDTHPIFKVIKPCNPNLFKSDQSPSAAEVPVGCGTAVVCRRDGATLRSGVNVDSSSIVMKLKYRQSVYFDRQVRIMPTDKRCLPVHRLHVYIADKKGRVTADGWLSLTGRTKDDRDPILKITRECTIGRKITEKKSLLSWLFRNRQAEKVVSAPVDINVGNEHVSTKSLVIDPDQGRVAHDNLLSSSITKDTV